jgi:hypothetical protein
MSETININQIIEKIDELDYTDKLNILYHIVVMLKKTETKSQSSITDLKGLGKELWQKYDIDAYISNERESWS